MKFISKISKQGQDYFIRIPRSKHNELRDNFEWELKQWELKEIDMSIEIRRALE